MHTNTALQVIMKTSIAVLSIVIIGLIGSGEAPEGIYATFERNAGEKTYYIPLDTECSERPLEMVIRVESSPGTEVIVTPLGFDKWSLVKTPSGGHQGASQEDMRGSHRIYPGCHPGFAIFRANKFDYGGGFASITLTRIRA